MSEEFNEWVAIWVTRLRRWNLDYDVFPSNEHILTYCPCVITDAEKSFASARFDEAKANRSDEYWNVS